jgi:hypothetical protein
VLAMSTGDLFNDAIAEFEAAFGVAFNVTHYTMSLGATQDYITGHYGKTYTPALIKMHIDIPTVTKQQTAVGRQTIVSANAYSLIKLQEWDLIDDAIGQRWLVVACEPYRVGDTLEFYQSRLLLNPTPAPTAQTGTPPEEPPEEPAPTNDPRLYGLSRDDRSLFLFDELNSRWLQRAEYAPNSVYINSPVVWNNELYGVTSWWGAVYGMETQGGRLMKWNNVNAWTQILSYSELYAVRNSLVLHDDKLFIVAGLTGAYVYQNNLYFYDGIVADWQDAAVGQYIDSNGLFSMVSFGGSLYAGGNSTGKLVRWNGTDAWVAAAAKFGSETRISCLCEFDGGLYAGTYPNGLLLKWNGSDAWTQQAAQFGSEYNVNALCEFGGELFGATTPNGLLLKWNGSDAWTQAAAQLNSQYSILCLKEYNSELYGGTEPNAKLFKWNGSNAWTEASDSYDVYESKIVNLVEYAIPAV